MRRFDWRDLIGKPGQHGIFWPGFRSSPHRDGVHRPGTRPVRTFVRQLREMPPCRILQIGLSRHVPDSIVPGPPRTSASRSFERHWAFRSWAQGEVKGVLAREHIQVRVRERRVPH